VIETLRNGIAAMMKKNKVEVVSGWAKLLGSGRVDVDGTVYEGTNAW